MISGAVKNPKHKAAKTLRPAWRLANCVINETEENRESSSRTCEVWSCGCGGLLLLGLVLEFVLAVFHPAYDSFAGKWGPAIADGCVTVGAGGEVLFTFLRIRCQGELDKRAKKAASESHKPAAEAPERNALPEKAIAEAEAGRYANELISALTNAGLTTIEARPHAGYEVPILSLNLAANHEVSFEEGPDRMFGAIPPPHVYILIGAKLLPHSLTVPARA